MKNKSTCIVLIIGILISLHLSSVVTADEYFPGLRWQNITYSNYYNHKVLDLKVNNDLISEPFKSAINDACSMWSDNSDNYVSASVESMNNSNVDFSLKSDWPAEWGALTVSSTLLYDVNGNLFINGKSFVENLQVNYSQVWVNPAGMNITPDMMNLSSIRALGYVCCLGHPSKYTVSVMNTSQIKYTTPQSYDRGELRRLYKTEEP